MSTVISIELNFDNLKKLNFDLLELPYFFIITFSFGQKVEQIFLKPYLLNITLEKFSEKENPLANIFYISFTLTFNVSFRNRVISPHADIEDNIRKEVITPREGFEEYKKLYREENRKTIQAYRDRLVNFLKKHFKIRENIGKSKLINRLENYQSLYIIYEIEFNSEETAKNVEYYIKLLRYRSKYDF